MKSNDHKLYSNCTTKGNTAFVREMTTPYYQLVYLTVCIYKLNQHSINENYFTRKYDCKSFLFTNKAAAMLTNKF